MLSYQQHKEHSRRHGYPQSKFLISNTHRVIKSKKVFITSVAGFKMVR